MISSHTQIIFTLQKYIIQANRFMPVGKLHRIHLPPFEQNVMSTHNVTDTHIHGATNKHCETRSQLMWWRLLHIDKDNGSDFTVSVKWTVLLDLHSHRFAKQLGIIGESTEHGPLYRGTYTRVKHKANCMTP